MSHVRPSILLICLAICAGISACASAPQGERSIIQTVRAGADVTPHRNVLVLSAAGDRASRLRFEQALSSTLNNDATSATAFFTVVGRYSPISRNILNNAVRVREFDSILLVRRQGQEKPELAPGRPTGRGFDLYHYDYEELNDLTPVSVDSTVAFVAELYDTASGKKIWAIESLLFDAPSVENALSAQVEMISGELKKDRLFAR